MKTKFTFLIALCLLMIGKAGAQVYTADASLTSGTYASVSWDPGVTITIPAGATVTINAIGYAKGNLIVNGDLTIANSDLTLDGDLTVNATMHVAKNLIFSKKVTAANNGTLTVDGNFTFNGNNSSVDILQGGTVNTNGTVNLNSGIATHVQGTLNVNGTLVLSADLTMDCPGAIYTQVMNVSNKLTNPVSGSGYIEVAGNFSSKNSLTASSTIVLNATVKNGNNAGAATLGTTTACATLPVIISDFNASAAKGGVALRWTSQTEINSKGFEIQVSSDGVVFENLAFIVTQSLNGNSSQALNYKYDDNRSLNGVRYYRIEQINLDGRAIIVPDIKKVSAGQVSEVRVYPNPAANYINISGTVATSTRIIDMQGRILLESAEAKIGIQKLSAGIYFVQQQASGKWSTVGRFVKQ